jgi:hypothetical protein
VRNVWFKTLVRDVAYILGLPMISNYLNKTCDLNTNCTDNKGSRHIVYQLQMQWYVQ